MRGVKKKLVISLISELGFVVDRLENFNVGYIDHLPTVGTSIEPSSYPLCAHYPQQVPNGETITIHCQFKKFTRQGSLLIV